MKNIISIFALFFVFQSCKLKEEKEKTKTAKQTQKEVTIVDDKDENGCLASAGYTWSQINKECIKVFNGIQLNPTGNPQNEDETLCVYVLFSEDGDDAEIFLPSQTKSLVLKRQSEGKPWVFQDWQLVPWKGYVLKEGEENKFSGDGEVGNKVTGSDIQE